MDHANKWFAANKMLISGDKTQVIYFGAKHEFRSLRYKFGEHTIHTVGEYKYLGVWLGQSLNFAKHMEECEMKATKAFYDYISKSRKVWGFNLVLFKKLFDTCIPIILDYGLEVWGPFAKRKTFKDKC